MTSQGADAKLALSTFSPRAFSPNPDEMLRTGLGNVLAHPTHGSGGRRSACAGARYSVIREAIWAIFQTIGSIFSGGSIGEKPAKETATGGYHERNKR
jgi:hypothetical protein